MFFAAFVFVILSDINRDVQCIICVAQSCDTRHIAPTRQGKMQQQQSGCEYSKSVCIMLSEFVNHAPSSTTNLYMIVVHPVVQVHTSTPITTTASDLVSFFVCEHQNAIRWLWKSMRRFVYLFSFPINVFAQDKQNYEIQSCVHFSFFPQRHTTNHHAMALCEHEKSSRVCRNETGLHRGDREMMENALAERAQHRATALTL